MDDTLNCKKTDYYVSVRVRLDMRNEPPQKVHGWGIR